MRSLGWVYMQNSIRHYCVGCGLCQSAGKATLKKDIKGFLHPKTMDSKWLSNICPVTNDQNDSSVWGPYDVLCYGWSTDFFVRKKASSGGVLTEIASYLLESGQVDGVLHTCMAKDAPTKTTSCISFSREELIEHCGSRYSISHPLLEINRLDKRKRYCFIGKPCDVVALRRFQRIQPEWNDIIPFVFSFLCAGQPSEDAQKTLLKTMNCDKCECIDLTYRGNGWPGFVTARTSKNKTYELDYNTAWGGILGRDIMPACRFCNDGIGIMADIACGDGWYFTEEGKPDFSERNGRNIIFVRNQKGANVIDGAIHHQRIEVEETDETTAKLQIIQKYQFIRRCTMFEKILALKLLCRSHPKYNLMKCRELSRYVDLSLRKEVFFGTVKRIIKGKA